MIPVSLGKGFNSVLSKPSRKGRDTLDKVTYYICGCFLLLWESSQVLFAPVFLSCLQVSLFLHQSVLHPFTPILPITKRIKQEGAGSSRLLIIIQGSVSQWVADMLSVHYQKLQCKSTRQGAKRTESC